MPAPPEEQLGTLEFMMIEQPDRGPFPVEATRELLSLAEAEIIRVLDIVVIDKRDDGEFDELEVTALDDAQGLQRFSGSLIDILTTDDVAKFAEHLTPHARAAVIVIENRWAAPLASALTTGGASCVASGALDVGSVARTLDAGATSAGFLSRRRGRPPVIETPIVRQSPNRIPATLIDRLLKRSNVVRLRGRGG